MPVCACYHNFDLELDNSGGGTVRLETAVGRDLLQKMLEASGLVASVGAQPASNLYDGIMPISALWRAVFRLTGVRNRTALEDFLGLIQHRVVIDLSPQLDECYSLGPYTIFDGGEPERARFGNLVRKAKHDMDSSAKATLTHEMVQFVQRHPRLRSVKAVAAPPRSERAAHNLPLDVARSVAEALGATVVEIRKTTHTGPRKALSMNKDAEVVPVANTMSVDSPVKGAVLIVDDTLGEGSTMKEAARALRQAGAQSVYGLCAAKDATGTQGGLSLAKEHWQ